MLRSNRVKRKSVSWNPGWFVFFVIFAISGHFLDGTSWRLSIGVASAGYMFFCLQHELGKLQDEFSIADAELVRMSSLVNDLEGQIIDMRYKLDELKASYEMHEH